MPKPDEVKKPDLMEQAAEKSSSTLETVMATKMAKMREEIVDDEPLVKVDDEKKVPSEPKDDDSVKTEDDSEVKDDGSAILPAGHRRAALARGWTNEEVDHYIEMNSDEAVVKFEEIFNARQKENSEWSARGRRLLATNQGAPKEVEVVTEGKKDGGTLSHYDVKKLIDEHGNEELINALVGPLNATIDRVNANVEKLSHSEEFLRGREEEALLVATQDFLKSKDMESYRDTYGVEVKDLTKEQQESRMKLFEQADIIVLGAQDHGHDITVQEALERAQMIVSHGTRDEVIRQGIRDSMKKRTKTLKSSHQKSPASDANRSLTEEEFEKRTAARMREIRNKSK